MVTNATGAGQEIMFAAAAGSHPRQGVEAFKFVGAPNANEKRKEASTKEASMPAAEPAGLAKQSGVRDIYWNCTKFARRVRFPKVDSKGKSISWTTRQRAVSPGCTEAEVDAAALATTKVFCTDLATKGILKSPG